MVFTLMLLNAALNGLTWIHQAEAAVVEYTWNVHPRRSRSSLSPDCFQDRDMLLINDNNPGEVLRANVSDKVKITIINHSPSEALTMHYHGISMYNQPYSDGAATRSQCDVGPMQVHRLYCHIEQHVDCTSCTFTHETVSQFYLHDPF